MTCQLEIKSDYWVCLLHELLVFCAMGFWGAKTISVGSLRCEIAAVRHREEEEKQRKKAKLAAKLRKLMEAEEKSKRKRYKAHF